MKVVKLALTQLLWWCSGGDERWLSWCWQCCSSTALVVMVLEVAVAVGAEMILGTAWWYGGVSGWSIGIEKLMILISSTRWEHWFDVVGDCDFFYVRR